MKSPFLCTTRSARADLRGLVTLPNATTNTSAAERPTSSRWPKAGRHFTCATPNRSAAQFAQVIQRLVAGYPFARKIHLVMDNLNIHCRKSLTDHLGVKEGRYIWNRLQVHYTPKHGSWLNQAEIELSLVSRQCLGTRRIPNLDLVQSSVSAWNTKANRDQTRIQWKFTRKAARTKFGYQRNISKRSKT